MNEPVKILVVDDEPGIRELLSFELGSRGYLISTAADGQEAVDRLKREKFQLVISDMKMTKMDGLDTLKAIKEMEPELEVIMATGYGSVETAVEAMKMGAYDFIQKPFNLDEILALVEKALEKSGLKAMVAIYEASLAVFNSMKLDDLLPTILKLAKRILKADEVSIMLLEPDGHLHVAAALPVDATGGNGRLALGERVAGKVAQSLQPAVIVGPLKDDPRFAGIPGSEDIRSSLVYPLAINGQLLGVLNANRIERADPFSVVDLRSATVFCSQIAQAVYNARLYRDVEDKMRQLKEAYDQLEETQNQLLQTEKLAAIGQLAAGVAHELNNPLTGILGFAQLLLQENGLSGQQREDLESIYKQSQRCRQIIQNLLQFSHRKQPKKEAIPLAALLDSSLRLVRYELSTSAIEVIQDMPESSPLVFGDPDQLQQVFLNLLANARQALEEKGGGTIRLSLQAEGDLVSVRVQDDGCGIPYEQQGKVFDPFFTTKPVGKGTGLGLSISYGIVRRHGGIIRVESVPEKGSTFIVDLPLHKP